MQNPRLIAVGDNCLDVYLTSKQFPKSGNRLRHKNCDKIQELEPFVRSVEQIALGFLAVGGNALNVAAQWSSLGADSRYFGAVGFDDEGGIILQALAEAGLDTKDVERREGATAVTLMAHEGGERRFLLESLGVGEDYFPNPSHYQDLTRCDFVHLGSHANLHLVQRLRQDRVRFSMDLSNHSFDHLDFAGVELVFASGGAAQSIPPLIEKIRQKGGEKILISCGAEGAYYYEEGQTLHTPALDVDVIDSCGAGDSFVACFILSKFFKNISAQQALTDATAHAALTCTHQGSFIQTLHPIPHWLRAKYTPFFGF